MGHDHSHHHHVDHRDAGDAKNIIVAFWLNTAFALIEIIGGFYTNSVAVLSDALHDLGDSLSLGLAYFFHIKSKKKRDKHFSYGYKRFSLLGAFINALVLIVSSIFIIRESAFRLLAPEQPDTRGMVVIAIIGIAVNVVAMYRLKRGESLNEKILSLHFLEDVLGWFAVLIGSVVMMWTYVPILDPILSVIISSFILYNVYKNLKTTFRILLQGHPEGLDEQEIRKKVLSVAGVKDVHDLHIWTMDGYYNIMTLHVVIDQHQSFNASENIKREVKHCLQHLNLQHVTIEMELEGRDCGLADC